jgi:NAD(P)-dependent dehydrogenase (short-subunit alcohol dehydrogenase family)
MSKDSADPLELVVRDYDATKRVIEGVISKFGKLDIWVSD